MKRIIMSADFFFLSRASTEPGAVETLTDLTDLVDKERQIETYRRELEDEDRFHGMIGVAKSMQQVFRLVENAARSDAPVIICGESGTGKELVANAIHSLGPRREKPYVKVNCAALSESLLESELFGHVKGAFTGAYQNRLGRFEAAQGGDIFLDEIGDLPLSTQVKLLRVLEEKVIERVGDIRPIQTDVRIISATNKNLRKLVDQGNYREDFFYRINVIPVSIPPLRERSSDIPVLAKAFFKHIRLKDGQGIRDISSTLDRLMQNALTIRIGKRVCFAQSTIFICVRNALGAGIRSCSANSGPPARSGSWTNMRQGWMTMQARRRNHQSTASTFAPLVRPS